MTSIQTSVQISHGGPNGYEGRAAGLWFLVAFLAVMMVLFLVLMKDTVGPIDSNAPPVYLEEEEPESKIDRGSAPDLVTE